MSARLPDELAEVLSPEPRVGGNGSAPLGRVVGGYLYTDEDGAPLFVVARLEPKSFRQGRVIGDRVDWQLGETRRVLYRLPQVIAHIEANSREPIFVVEGEKDADAIIAAGGIATCNPMGAGKWLDHYAESLRGARCVLVVVDQDEQRGDDGLTIGERHARDIRESLAAVGVTVELVRAAAGKDAADHLAAGRSLAELEPFELPTAAVQVAAPDSWRPLDLSAAEHAQESEPPAIAGLLYRGLRHALSGPPEAAKTLTALICALEHHRATGARFAYISFEMSAAATRRLLDDLGATPEELRACWYVEPDGPPSAADVESMLAAGVALATIDAAAGAFGVSGLDDNKRADAERFARDWIRPLWQAGVTTILIDHVTKAAEGRGKYAIGSERKLGQVDVHLGLEAVTPLHRGHDGLVRVTTHKDRPGHLPRPRAADIHLRSSNDGAIGWAIQHAEPTATERSSFRPTILMDKVVAYLHAQVGPVPRSAIETAVTGKRDYLRLAIDLLAAEGEITEHNGARGARLYALANTRKRDDLAPNTPDDLAPTSPHTQPLKQAEISTSPHLAPTSPPESDVIRRGALKLCPVAELERWLRENAARTLDDDVCG